MARRSLKPQLNQIRTWVRQGRTDMWIAHQLEVTVKDLAAFKREHDLAPDGDADEAGSEQAPADEERDLREEDDALVAAELDAMSETNADGDGDAADEEEAEGEGQARRRRGRRGGRRRRGGGQRSQALEGTFDHGEEGYGLWLDPAVQDNAVYAEHWRGHRAVTVAVEPDRIVIRRSGAQTDEPDAEAAS